MKLKKITTANATSTIGQGMAVVGGMLVSNGVSAVLPIQNKTVAKAILTAVGFAGAIAGSNSKVLSGVALGMGVQQAKELIKDVVADKLPANDGSTVKNFINSAFENNGGVAQAPALNSPYRFRLANPIGAEGSESDPSVIEFAMR